MQYLSVKQTCAKLSIGRTTLTERWSKDPRMPKPVRKGGRVFYVEHELEAYQQLLVDERDMRAANDNTPADIKRLRNISR